MLSLKNASVYFEAQTRRIETQQIPLGAEFKICLKLKLAIFWSCNFMSWTQLIKQCLWPIFCTPLWLLIGLIFDFKVNLITVDRNNVIAKQIIIASHWSLEWNWCVVFFIFNIIMMHKQFYKFFFIVVLFFLRAPPFFFVVLLCQPIAMNLILSLKTLKGGLSFSGLKQGMRVVNCHETLARSKCSKIIMKLLSNFTCHSLFSKRPHLSKKSKIKMKEKKR